MTTVTWISQNGYIRSSTVATYPNDEEEASNPFLALLDQTEENEEEESSGNYSFVPSSDEEEEVRNDTKKMSDRLDALERENEELKGKAAAAPTYNQPQTPQQQYQAPVYNQNSEDGQRQAVINSINEKFARNPGEAMFETMLQMQKQAEEASRRNLAPVAAQNTRFAIDNFAANSIVDADVKAEFKKLVSNLTSDQLATANPSELPIYLDNIRKVAWANAQEAKEHASKRTNAVPPFSGGAGGRSGPMPIRLTKQQNDIVKMYKSQKITDKQIQEMLKNGEI
jgi:hypothetical protein